MKCPKCGYEIPEFDDEDEEYKKIRVPVKINLIPNHIKHFFTK